MPPKKRRSFLPQYNRLQTKFIDPADAFSKGNAEKVLRLAEYYRMPSDVFTIAMFTTIGQLCRNCVMEQMAPFRTYPHLYQLIVAPSSVGKSKADFLVTAACNFVSTIRPGSFDMYHPKTGKTVPGIAVNGDWSLIGLLCSLNKSTRTGILDEGDTSVTSRGLFCTEKSMPNLEKGDRAMAMSLWDNKESHYRTLGNAMIDKIIKPRLNLLVFSSGELTVDIAMFREQDERSDPLLSRFLTWAVGRPVLLMSQRSPCFPGQCPTIEELGLILSYFEDLSFRPTEKAQQYLNDIGDHYKIKAQIFQQDTHESALCGKAGENVCRMTLTLALAELFFSVFNRLVSKEVPTGNQKEKVDYNERIDIFCSEVAKEFGPGGEFHQLLNETVEIRARTVYRAHHLVERSLHHNRCLFNFEILSEMNSRELEIGKAILLYPSLIFTCSDLNNEAGNYSRKTASKLKRHNETKNKMLDQLVAEGLIQRVSKAIGIGHRAIDAYMKVIPGKFFLPFANLLIKYDVQIDEYKSTLCVLTGSITENDPTSALESAVAAVRYQLALDQT